jgi:hypothetical protein
MILDLFSLFYLLGLFLSFILSVIFEGFCLIELITFPFCWPILILAAVNGDLCYLKGNLSNEFSRLLFMDVFTLEIEFILIWLLLLELSIWKFILF